MRAAVGKMKAPALHFSLPQRRQTRPSNIDALQILNALLD
jgi:hypothetical protein